VYKISITIITYNEERNIDRCLNSVQWADEIIVVDSGSTDRTLAICQKYHCKVINQPWSGFGAMKHFAVNTATHDWIFAIDADEKVTDELKSIIQQIIIQPQYTGYRVKRISYYLDKKIRYSGWNHDHPIRLFNRRYGNFNDKPIHESVKIRGKIGKIESPLLHYPYPTITSHLQKMNYYADLSAEWLARNGKSCSIFMAIISGIIKFLKMYFLQMGFLDGKYGLILARNSAFGVYLKYVKLWEKTRKPYNELTGSIESGR
jgi:glycosyltransferase involved in cell wall biosynthesis